MRYHISLGIRDRLTQSDPGNAGWQRRFRIHHDPRSAFAQEGCVATILATAQTAGFAMLDLNGLSLAVLLNLFRRAGHSVSQTVLTPKDQSPESQKKTLSAIYGRHAFPYHNGLRLQTDPSQIHCLSEREQP
jgi:hypothetical protein